MPARGMDRSNALKPLVLMHAECPDHESDVENRLPKNQWLMYRRICSLPDESKKHTILFQKSQVSAKEQIRLDINHWFFGRRFLIAILMSHESRRLALQY